MEKLAPALYRRLTDLRELPETFYEGLKREAAKENEDWTIYLQYFYMVHSLCLRINQISYALALTNEKNYKGDLTSFKVQIDAASLGSKIMESKLSEEQIEMSNKYVDLEITSLDSLDTGYQVDKFMSTMKKNLIG